MKVNSWLATVTGLFSLISLVSVAQIPPGYYDSAEGLTGEALREELQEIIDDHTVLDYSILWLYFEILDQKSNGKVWDIYSDVPQGPEAYEYSFITDQCGNYSGEGDCFNREHAFPQSWFNDNAPMDSDLFHIYPTDGFVNGMRSNNAYGPVGNASWTSSNGSRLGSCSLTEYSGIVFEPIDAYKGDLARSYFYMLTRYADQVGGWNSDMLVGDNFTNWSRELLLEWASDDPVSQKEIDRNNGIYDYQNNRNPFIDRPEFAIYIWDEASVGLGEEITTNLHGAYNGENIKVWSDSELIREIMVISLSGQTVFRDTYSASQVVVPVALTDGFYLVRVQSQSNTKVIRLFVH